MSVVAVEPFFWVGYIYDGPHKKNDRCNDLLSRGWRYTKAASAKGDKDQVRRGDPARMEIYVDSELEELR